MEHHEIELALLDRFEKTDIAQRAQRRRQQAGAHVDDGHAGIRAVDSVSKMRIWSGTEVTSTMSVMSGWKRLSVPFGDSVSKARVGT